ncbi:SRPBCC family protein [Streptomyces collinus]|uniref:SRPBCC family protein n=1 Tax=Streptomyces collinus TaxID=42684 RepID=UPI00380DBF23
MPRIEHSTVINAKPERVFELTNDISLWPKIFNGYRGVEVLSWQRNGRFTKIFFELTDDEGSSWRSWRLLDHEELIAIAERAEPLYPFAFMHLKWTYQAAADSGTSMTWIQDFELDESCDIPVEQAVARMVAHTRDNQRTIKERIEAGDV